MVSTWLLSENALQETFKVFINSMGKSQDPGILFFRLLIKTAGIHMNSFFFPPQEFHMQHPLLKIYKNQTENISPAERHRDLARGRMRFQLPA